MGEASWNFRVKYPAWSLRKVNIKLGRRNSVYSCDLLFSYFHDMIEKLCPGLASCSVYKHLLLLYSSKIILPIRAALFCFSTNMEARSLVSTSWVLCTADSVFYCMLNYDSHILVGTKLSLSLDTRDHVLVCM